jgi:hypothetical protein
LLARKQMTLMRVALLVSAGLAAGAGLQLFVGATHTDHYFAWTIEPPLTAAFLGAMYLGAVVLLLMGFAQTTWADTRVAFIATSCLVPLLFVVTLIHLDRFHTGSNRTVTLVGTWIFITTYGWLPVLLAAAFVTQVRAAGSDPPRMRPLPAWIRVTLVAQAFVLLGLGLALMVAPTSVRHVWPWELTPLTGRATAAWLLSIGAAAAAGARENDLGRIRVPLAAYVALSILTAVAIARYSGTVDWSHPGAWGIVVALASMLLLGVGGLAVERRTRAGAVAAPSTA